MDWSAFLSGRATQFAILFLAASASTVIVHALLLRIASGFGLLRTSVLASLAAGAGLVLIVAYRFPACAEITLPSWVASFMCYQLFFFLGPATADRSLTAHLLMLLRQSPPLEESEILRRYSPDAFLQKRYAECSGSGLLRHDGGRISLRGRGRAFASIYAGLVRLYGLDQRKEWRYSFRPSPASPSEAAS